jgi:phosphoglycolate phosphatase
MAEMAVARDDCILVGDSGIDIDTAKSAGIRAIGVTWGFRDKEELLAHGADIIADSPHEVFEFLFPAGHA